MLRKVLFVCFIFTCSIAGAQSPLAHIIDSLTTRLAVEKNDSNKVNTLTLLSDKTYKAGQKDKAMQYGIDALDLCGRINYLAGEPAAFKCIGNVYYSKLKYADALRNFIMGLNVSLNLKDSSQAATLYTRIGLTYFRQANLPQSLQANLNALKIREDMKDSVGMTTALVNLGNVYSEQGRFAEALKTEQRAYDISVLVKEKFNITASLNNIGGIHVKMKNYDEALNDFKKTIELEQKADDQEGVAIAYNNIGEIYMDKGNYNEALDYVGKSLVLKRKVGYKRGLESVFINYSTIYNLMKQYAKGRIYADTILMQSLASGSKDYIEEGYMCMAVADSGMGNYKSALANYEKARQWHDSLKNEENTKQVVEAEMNYEFEKKQDAQRAEEEKIKIKNDVEARKQRITIYFISGILALVIVFAFFIARSLQQNRRKTIIISKQKEEVEKQNELIERQKAIVEEKNKEVLDSIIYAKRLQDAILPPLNIIKTYLPDSFVMYKPKDIVAGDFYWMWSETTSRHSSSGEMPEQIILIAACDCTGHGVPGALVSVVCSNALNRTVKEFKITEPGKILDKVRELVLETFSHRDPFGDKSESEVKDGMDISLVAISQKQLAISWAGAYNPLWIIPAGEGIIEVEPDKQPIGKTDNPKQFSTHKLSLKKGDILYLFTDGYADQFGGPKGKKFKYKQLQEKLLAISNRPMVEQKKELETEFDKWKGSLEQVDDVLIIGIRV
jgi:tetratricopeptide (TPR) repeat protein